MARCDDLMDLSHLELTLQDLWTTEVHLTTPWKDPQRRVCLAHRPRRARPLPKPIQSSHKAFQDGPRWPAISPPTNDTATITATSAPAAMAATSTPDAMAATSAAATSAPDTMAATSAPDTTATSGAIGPRMGGIRCTASLACLEANGGENKGERWGTISSIIFQGLDSSLCPRKGQRQEQKGSDRIRMTHIVFHRLDFSERKTILLSQAIRYRRTCGLRPPPKRRNPRRSSHSLAARCTSYGGPVRI